MKPLYLVLRFYFIFAFMMILIHIIDVNLFSESSFKFDSWFVFVVFVIALFISPVNTLVALVIKKTRFDPDIFHKQWIPVLEAIIIYLLVSLDDYLLTAMKIKHGVEYVNDKWYYSSIFLFIVNCLIVLIIYTLHLKKWKTK